MVVGAALSRGSRTVDAPRETVARARHLRHSMTPPELRLWAALRRRPDGFKFRRQHPFGPYVLDFYCDAAKLAVEVDGLTHDVGDRPTRDMKRDAWILQRGVTVMRFPAEEVRVNLEGVVTGIAAEALKRCGLQPPPPRFARSPAPKGGGDEHHGR